MTLDLGRLRACLLSEEADCGAGDGFLKEAEGDAPATPAAVLVPIVLGESPGLLLTQRTDHLRDHPGQISFPGGRVESADVSATATALREAEEEIGLPESQVEVVGFLPQYRTGTGFLVTPVVALVRPPLSFRVDPFEVAEVFEVPLDFLLDPANHREHTLHYRGALRSYWAIPYGDRFIWGATAGMIRMLAERMASGRAGNIG